MWTFSPMVDTARDQRWGRNIEGAGEETLQFLELGPKGPWRPRRSGPKVQIEKGKHGKLIPGPFPGGGICPSPRPGLPGSGLDACIAKQSLSLKLQ